jgi:hypothetical protein
MLFFYPMERGHLLSYKYVLLALSNRKQLHAAVYIRALGPYTETT